MHLGSFDLIVLFFFLGIFASWVQSDLDIPASVSKFLSIFLLLSLGLRGGHEVRMAEDVWGFLPALTIGLSACVLIPLVLFFSFHRHLTLSNAAAIAAAYGSVSAVTFITAQGFLENKGVSASGYMVAVMALMEIPAIVIAMFLFQKFSVRKDDGIGRILKSLLAMKSVILLLGGFLIGLAMNEASWTGISPVVQGCFKGFLIFFLLDLGVEAQKQLREAWRFKRWALLIAFVLPLVFGSLALLAGLALDLSVGDRVLVAVLVGSGSYIAAPAAVRATIPSANPGLYLALPLALTFPMNLLVGIPYYLQLSQWLAGGN